MSNNKLVAFIPLIILFTFELIYRGNLSSTLYWITHYPSQFIVSYAIFFGLVNIFYIFPRRIYGAFGLLILSFLIIIAFVSRQKLLLRGEPLLPWDFNLGNEALNISLNFEGSVIDIPLALTAIICTVIILSCICILYIPKERYVLSTKAITAILSFALFFTLVEYIPLQKTFSFRIINWSQKSNYEENGMILGFILNSKSLSVEEPRDYQQKAVKQLIGQAAPTYPTDPDFEPNIIFVMSEAFWDPTVLEDISFSEDPIPYFRSLQQEYTSGSLLTPVYGGGTANTEFEVLTGLSTKFLPAGIIPYVQFVHKPLEALPTIYKRQGYETTAIHTYDNWFYRRNIVYKYMGFDKYISKEFFIDPEYNGTYIRDTELSQKILQTLQQSDQPDFIFAISMQAHGPYSNKENPNNSIQVSGANLAPETNAILENYTNTITDVDHSLKLLIEGLEQLAEPSMVIFFSDHLPMLGNDFDVYKEANFFQNVDTYDDYTKKYSAPFIVWDNFSNKREKLRLSSSFLGSYILERSMKEGSPLTDFLHTLNKKSSNVVTVSHYNLHENITDEELAQYQLLQYDFLIGNEYTYLLKPLHKPNPNPLYMLGNNQATIGEVHFTDRNMLKVQGINFSPRHQIYINNRPLPTSFTDDTLLTATLSKSYPENSQMEIQVKLTDSMENIISESNKVSKVR